MAALERSDLQENATAYAAQLAGAAQTVVAPFGNVSVPLTFNTSHHGLCYAVGLLVRVGASWSKAVRTVAVLTSKKPARCRPQGRTEPGPAPQGVCVPTLRTSAGPLGTHPGLQAGPGDRSGV